MDVLSMTSKYREDLLKFIRPILDDRSYIWVRNLITDINHKIVAGDIEFIQAHAIVMYRNIIPFFRHYCAELTASGILYTFYSCSIELGVRSIGNEIETYEQFQEDIDMEDWSLVDIETIKHFDILTAQKIIKQKFEFDEADEIWAGGLYALETLDFL